MAILPAQPPPPPPRTPSAPRVANVGLGCVLPSCRLHPRATTTALSPAAADAQRSPTQLLSATLPPRHHKQHLHLSCSISSNPSLAADTMLALRLAAFTLAPPLCASACHRAALFSAPHAVTFPPWRPPPFRPSFPRVPRSLRPSSSAPPSFLRGPPAPRTPSGPTGPVPPSAADPDTGLFASSPELERLAMKSTDAPILTRVVSYNLLSSALANPSHFTACDPANLDAATRLKRVLTKLEGPVASRSIICLQEVSLAWSGHLHAFFANRGFHLVLASHGSYFNGYMGEGLAFPLDLYEAVDLRIERLTDMMEWPNRRKPTGMAAVVSEVSSRLQKAIHALQGSPKPKRMARREPWDHARGRYNRFIFARLRSRTNGAKLCVATYHMPCIFWSPPVMLIHCALVVRSFQRLCDGDDGVLAGDFNIKPSDSSYRMIMSGEVDRTHDDFPPVCPDGMPPEKWFPTPLAPMKSAYREVLGAEPDFTNYAKTENQPVFIETLDYLFCTQSVDVVDVIRLPHRTSVQGPLPDASEPSDHVMIGATLRLPAASAVAAAKREQRISATLE